MTGPKTSISFITNFCAKVDTIFQVVNTVVDGVNNAKPYEIEWTAVVEEYKQNSFNDIEEFAANYTFGYHMLHDNLNDEISKEAMRIELKMHLLQLQEEGVLE